MEKKINLFQKDAEKFLNTIEATNKIKTFIRQSANAADKMLNPEYRKERKLRIMKLLMKKKH
jgi:hypothetical protein